MIEGYMTMIGSPAEPKKPPSPPVRRQTYSIDEAAVLLGVSRGLVYADAKKTGAVCGVPVMTIGKRQVLPKIAFDRKLGLTREIP
jgi:hypothetical protein